MKYLEHKEIDKEKWDRCVRQASQSLLYALSFYLDIVAPCWAALVEEENDSYVTVIPLTTQKKYGITFLHQPLFCQQLGVFSTKKEVFPTKEILEKILKHYALCSHYHFNIGNQLSVQATDMLQMETHYTHLLSLNCSYSIIYKNYSLDRKKNLKRAQKANLTIMESGDIEPLIRMFEQDISGKIEGGVAANAYNLLREIYATLKERKMCELLYTQNPQGEINAGALFAFYQNQIIYLFNAAYTRARKENGRMLLIDCILRKYACSDKIFDFESPEIPSIAYFYESFGAKAVSYNVLIFNDLPIWINWLWKVKKRLNELRQLK